MRTVRCSRSGVRATVGLLLLGMLWMTGCGGEETAAPPAARPTAATRTTYQWYCAQCHGVKGKGNGINAPHTAVPPRDHTKAEYLETRTDEQLFHVIKFGGLAGGRAPCMPQWGHTLDDPTIHALVSYIRELCRCEAL